MTPIAATALLLFVTIILGTILYDLLSGLTTGETHFQVSFSTLLYEIIVGAVIYVALIVILLGVTYSRETKVVTSDGVETVTRETFKVERADVLAVGAVLVALVLSVWGAVTEAPLGSPIWGVLVVLLGGGAAAEGVSTRRKRARS